MMPNEWVESISRVGVPIALLAWILWYATRWGEKLVNRHISLIDELVVAVRELKDLSRSIREREETS